MFREADRYGSIGSTSGAYDPDKLILELQPTEKGQQSQLLEADIVLWTVGSRSLLPQLETCEFYELPLNGRGQVETEETLLVKDHPCIFAVGDSSAARDSKRKLLPPLHRLLFSKQILQDRIGGLQLMSDLYYHSACVT